MLLPISKISFWASLGVLAGLAVAQVGTSSVTGRVVDPTGAVVPNAQLTMVQTETNFKFTATTNNEGIYRIQSLQPGTYEMTVAASGFKSLIRQNIVLRTGDVLGIDLELEVGATTESIRVSA
jgi:hypothetical protein